MAESYQNSIRACSLRICVAQVYLKLRDVWHKMVQLHNPGARTAWGMCHNGSIPANPIRESGSEPY
jgi:hypothetical protein